LEAVLFSKKPLCGSHFLSNSLGKLTGKLFQGTGIFCAATGNLNYKNAIWLRRSISQVAKIES
jgi:uncharacterized protein YbbK (DUF523 family)